ncbi:HAD hydrolase family protein [Marinobacter sp.]|uniref:KdsC family phosphatase n=1 Tax=Marinobacter sp. TaxID=50741 RepID=UPI0019A7E2ED|nr:HAD hydrolase family protein [Marinobacter sp.]MBC7193590.1 HAD hydrolase family protein [Marinobacter sp.]
MSSPGTLPHWPQALLHQAADIQLLALDVDGVLSDGTLYFTANGDEIKGFNILDGHGLKQVMKAGITVAVITGRRSPLTEKRIADLGIRHLIQGREDKRVALQELSDQLGIRGPQIAYMGDDLPDLAAICMAGLGITVPNGHWFVRRHADYCTENAGGQGAVREVCDMLLAARGCLQQTLEKYLGDGHS